MVAGGARFMVVNLQQHFLFTKAATLHMPRKVIFVEITKLEFVKNGKLENVSSFLLENVLEKFHCIILTVEEVTMDMVGNDFSTVVNDVGIPDGRECVPGGQE